MSLTATTTIAAPSLSLTTPTTDAFQVWYSLYRSRLVACATAQGASDFQDVASNTAFDLCAATAGGEAPAVASYLIVAQADNSALASGVEQIYHDPRFESYFATATATETDGAGVAYNYDGALVGLEAWEGAATAFLSSGSPEQSAVISVYSVARSLQADAAPTKAGGSQGAATTSKSSAGRASVVRGPTLAGVLVLGLMGLVMVL